MKDLFENKLIINIFVLIAIVIFLFSYFKPELIFLKTTINGGDTGSHYPTFVHLKEVFLPKAKIMGWMQDNYAGFPLFYHYFPLPFLIMVFFSLAFSMEVAFKLGTIVGIFLLPFCVYFCFKNLKYEFPIPIIASVFTLPFLFNQGNSMWGANIPSTLAGEFCYSLGTALVFLFIGTLYRGVEEKKFLILNAVLIFLIGLSHAYALILALIAGAFFAFKDLKQNFWYLLGTYSLGGLFLAFWLLPVLGTAPYITSFVFRWTIRSILEVFPFEILPFMFLSLAALFLNRKDKRTHYFLYLVLSCVAVYIIGPRIGVLDIRFVPFFQILTVVFGATLIKNYIKDIKMIFILPLIVFFSVAVWVNLNTTYIPQWITWNYSGYQKKDTWPIFNEITQYLKHSGTGRVAWEHTPLDEPLGSIRTPETLPYFAKRQTLEGIHMLGAISAPFVFYMESEYSPQPCNPLGDYYYSAFNLKRNTDHFKLFNTTQLVARSDRLKKALKDSPEYELEKTVGEYEIYRLKGHNSEYVVPLKNKPILFVTDNWRKTFYDWFAKKEDLKNTFLVLEKDPKAAAVFGPAISGLDQVRSISYPTEEVKVKSVLGPESIDIETSKIGHPLLIKVSYHPNWKVKGAEKVYFVSPCFMLVFPKEHKVQLTFEQGIFGKIGLFLSLFGILVAFLFLFWYKRSTK